MRLFRFVARFARDYIIKTNKLSTQYSRVNKEAMVPMLTPPHPTQQKHVTHSLNLYPRPATVPTM